MPERHDMSEADRMLEQALRAVRAEADPRPLARAMARLESGARLPAWLEWATRPRALAAALAVFVACAAFAVTLEMRGPVVVRDDAAALADAIQSEVEGVSLGDATDDAGTQADSGRAL